MKAKVIVSGSGPSEQYEQIFRNAHINIVHGTEGGEFEFSIFNSDNDEVWTEVVSVKFIPI